MEQNLENFTFGVEIECLAPRHGSRDSIAAGLRTRDIEVENQMYNHRAQSQWKIVSDGSVSHPQRTGAEVVSPVLRGQAGLDEVARVCRALEAIGCVVNRTCGLHIHVGIRGTPMADDVDFFKRLVKLYAKFEPVIDTFVAPSRRGNANSYCRKVELNACIERAGDMHTLFRAYNNGSRYAKLNLQSYWRHGTVEFRQHQGTTDARKVTNWVIFCLRMVSHAASVEDKPRIRVLAHTNPHRPGTEVAERWNKYVDGMTVEDAAAAVTLRWVNFDVRHVHNIEIVVPVAPEVTLKGLMTHLKASDAEETFFAGRVRLLSTEALGSYEGSEINAD